MGEVKATVRLPERRADQPCRLPARRRPLHRRRGRSGAAFVGAFAERLGEVTPLARNAEISYEKIAKGPIDATARSASPR